MKKRFPAIAAIVFIMVILCSTVAAAAEPYDNYIYDSNETPQQEPQAYIPEKVITGSSMGTVDLNSPQDLFVLDNGDMYIADSGNNRIVVFDAEYSVKQIISEFKNSETVETLNKPQGVFVAENGYLYIADTGNQRIVCLDADGNAVKIFGVPTSSLYSTQYAYEPVKLVVDSAGRLYVVSLNSSQGIIELNADGEFMAYFGAVSTTPSLGQILRRMLPFDFLKDSSSLNIPTEYSSVAIDKLDMVYGTVGIIDSENFDTSQFIHRLNPSGIDILKRNGTNPPMGDVQLQEDKENDTKLTSYLCDIVVRDNGIYSALDRRLGRVFTYSPDGELMYVFGGTGDSMGQVSIPAALEYYDGRYFVLDSMLNQIIVYKPTLYGNCINGAIESYSNKEYEKSSQKWAEALSYTSKSILVYNGVADTAYKAGDYDRAMYYYKLAQNRKGYSKAFKNRRQEFFDDNFSLMFIFIVVLIVAVIVYSVVGGKKKKIEKPDKNNLWDKVKYSLYVMVHPFKGFWGLKREKRGNMFSSLIIVLSLIVVFVLRRQLTGFIVNENDITKMNILIQFSLVLLPLVLWTVGNWAITTLMDGEGTMKDVFITTSYALTPLIIFNIPMLILSNILTLDEMSIYVLLDTVAILWVCYLMIIGIQTVHQFTFGKTIATILLAIVSMAVLAGIGLLLISLIQQMWNFIEICYFELLMR